MKKLFYFILGITVLISAQFTTFKTEAHNAAVSPHLVISQFQAGGGVAEDEFVEIHNTSSSPIDLNGYRVVYRSASGTNDVGPFAQWSKSTIIPAGGFYLIASTAYDGAATPNITYNPSTCACSMGAAGGGLAIKNSSGTIIDSVGWGTATNAFVETAATGAPGNNNSQSRTQNGCQDTDNNSSDFANFVPSIPRDGSSTPVECAGSGASLFASMQANPTNIVPGNNTLLTVSVIPATTPPSTNVTVAANLQSIGGAQSQTFFDNGTNGDVTAGDNVFSFLATVAVNTPGGIAPIAGAAVDFQARVASVQVFLTINAPLPNEDPLLLGNPSNATSDVANENNYLMIKPQYSLSYNRSKATPNWVAWRLDSSWISTFNNGDFDVDNSLPVGWYRVTPDDYDEPVYDRGHMCPSGDRTRTQADNSATYLMTNIIPQHPDNNQGTWNDFENYCRSVAQQGNEIYIISGPEGNIGKIGTPEENEVVVPARTWKVVLIIPNGTDDLHRINKGTRAFGIIMQNTAQSRNTPWRTFRVPVNTVENLTGYDFFSNVPKGTQELIERQRDRL